MLNIKSLLLGFFAVILISSAYTLFIAGIILYDLPDNIQELKIIIEEQGSELIGQNMEIEGIDENDFEEMKQTCSYIEFMPEEDSEELEFICEKINSGEVTNLEEFYQVIAKETIDEKLDEAMSGIEKSVRNVHSYYPYVFVGFLILYSMSAFVVWLNNIHIGEWIRSFSRYNLFATAPTAVLLLLFYIFTNQLGGIAVEQIMDRIELPEDSEDLIGGLSSIIAEWLRKIVELPLIVYTVIVIVSLFGMFTGFGVPKKRRSK